MGKVRTVIVSVLLAGAGIALAAWAPVTDLGYTGASSGLLGGALVGAALALLVSELAGGGSATRANRPVEPAAPVQRPPPTPRLLEGHPPSKLEPRTPSGVSA